MKHISYKISGDLLRERRRERERETDRHTDREGDREDGRDSERDRDRARERSGLASGATGTTSGTACAPSGPPNPYPLTLPSPRDPETQTLHPNPQTRNPLAPRWSRVAPDSDSMCSRCASGAPYTPYTNILVNPQPLHLNRLHSGAGLGGMRQCVSGVVVRVVGLGFRNLG